MNSGIWIWSKTRMNWKFVDISDVWLTVLINNLLLNLKKFHLASGLKQSDNHQHATMTLIIQLRCWWWWLIIRKELRDRCEVKRGTWISTNSQHRKVLILSRNIRKKNHKSSSREFSSLFRLLHYCSTSLIIFFFNK